tara:strand:+ start:2293 stop:2775 length:483 start_codon:yes stop_codon:yes gene_type:complete
MNEIYERNITMSKLYLAYGSNLNKKQMAVRCPAARPVGSAMIYGWELVFRGVADIVKSKDTSMYLPVGIWEIEPEDELSLDVYEGYRGDDTSLYDKIKVAGIMTYQMTSDGIYAPSASYFNSILEGYRDFGLDTSYLYDSAGWAGYQSNHSDNVFGLEAV